MSSVLSESLPWSDAAIAEAFVSARLAARSLPGFPGEHIPADQAAGYRIQDAAIARWPDDIAGWKIGFIAPARRDASNDERVLGPVFARQLRFAGTEDDLSFPVFAGGFAAVEAEYAFRIAHDVPIDRHHYDAGAAAKVVDAMHIAIETAGSPLATINHLGPTVVVSDFGNNAGLIVGPAIRDWRTRDPASLRCATFVDGEHVGSGGAERLQPSPLAALAFALGRLARRGHAPRAGCWITTGAATGIHDIVSGASALIDFGGDGRLRCHAVPAAPHAAPASC